MRMHHGGEKKETIGNFVCVGVCICYFNIFLTIQSIFIGHELEKSPLLQHGLKIIAQYKATHVRQLRIAVL